jgi:hypothetical protein
MPDMHKLIVNPDTASAWEIELKSGANSIGRNQENDVWIDHPSISSVHCQIVITERGAAIKDLGSTGGTFINDSLIEEAPLAAVQMIRLGEVNLRFEPDLSQGTEPLVSLAPPAAAAPSTSHFCKFHPKAVARYLCPQCEAILCELCVTRRNEHDALRKFCRTCDVECSPITIRSAASTAPKTFASQITGALAYPFKADGVMLLVAGTIFYVVLGFVAARAAIVGLAVMFFGTGYLVSYYQRILLTSATGEAKMPDWPDFTNLGDFVSPVLQFIGTALFAFGPFIALNSFAPPDAAWRLWAIGAAIIFGGLYFPMAFLAVTMADSLSALNPLIIIPAILKIPTEYLLMVILTVAIVGAGSFGELLLARWLPVPILPSLMSEFLTLYLGTVAMRLLGLLHWTKKADLAWFSR